MKPAAATLRFAYLHTALHGRGGGGIQGEGGTGYTERVGRDPELWERVQGEGGPDVCVDPTLIEVNLGEGRVG